MAEQKYGAPRGSVVLNQDQQAALKSLEVLKGLNLDLNVFEGHHELMPASDGDWSLAVQPFLDGGRPSREGWLDYEWLVWATRGHEVKVSVFSAAPYLNTPGATMHLWIHGNRERETVEDFARQIVAEYAESGPGQFEDDDEEVDLIALLGTASFSPKASSHGIPSVELTDEDYKQI